MDSCLGIMYLYTANAEESQVHKDTVEILLSSQHISHVRPPRCWVEPSTRELGGAPCRKSGYIKVEGAELLEIPVSEVCPTRGRCAGGDP